MRITIETTDEEILSVIKFAQESLLHRVMSAQETDEVRGEVLVIAAQRVADNEDLAHAQFRFRQALLSGSSNSRLMGLLFDLATQPRQTNGSVCRLVCEWASQQIDDIRYSA